MDAIQGWHRAGAGSGDQLDAVIIGGGLAGLSLLAHLGASDWRDRKVLLIDDGGASACTSWGFWSDRPGLLDAAVSHDYRQVLVNIGGVSRVVQLGRYGYRRVRRDDLRRTAERLVRHCPGFTFGSGRVSAAHTHGDSNGECGGVEVVVDGQTLSATWAFDSRRGSGSAGPPADASMAFTGWEIVVDRPVFEVELPTLMDFRTHQGDGACFVYVLPSEADRALVEYTAFVPRHARPPNRAATEAALTEYVTGVIGARNYTILRKESGLLPLRARPIERVRGRSVAIGARAGLVRASTGYAYQRIQRDSASIAASLVRSGHPFDLPTISRRHHLYDAALLSVLAREPADVQRAFARLFAANSGERVLRFLDEGSSPLAEARLIATFPIRPFARATARELPRLLGTGGRRDPQPGDA